MKFSQFNSIIPLPNKYNIMYNSLSDIFLIISRGMVEKISHISMINPDENDKLYQDLVKLGAIIDDNINELALVKELRDKTDLNPNIYRLTINPTLDCNFKCWYCYENHVKKSKMDENTLQKVKNFIANLINETTEIRNITLNFFGGEPFLQPSVILNIIDYIVPLCEKFGVHLAIGITTNAFMLNKAIITKLVQYKVEYSMQITLDGGREQHNNTRFASTNIGSYDKIISNMKLLLQHDISVIARINYTVDNIHSIPDIIKDLEKIIDRELKSKFRITLFRVWQDDYAGIDIQNKVNNVSEKLNNAGFMTTPQILNNVRYSCYADKKNGAVVNYNGDVFRCTARDFKTENRNGYINEYGSITWENDADNIRMNAKFKNKPCLSCRILPICNGGCSQKAIESYGKDYCTYKFDDRKIDNAILDIFKTNIRYNPEWKR